MSSGRIWMATLLAVCALAGRPAHSATARIGSLALRESLSQRMVCNDAAGCVVADTRSLAASFDISVEPAVTAGFGKTTRISFRLGTLRFEAALGDDPHWTTVKRIARFPLPATSGKSAGRVTATWTTRHVFVKVNARTAAVLGGISPPRGVSKIRPYVDAAMKVADGTWFYAGQSKGRARVHDVKHGAAKASLIQASVTAAGLPATLSDDRKPPAIRIDKPKVNEFFALSPVTVSGVVTDDREIARIESSIDGAPPAAIAFVVDPQSGGATDQSATFSFDVSVVVEGLHFVSVCVYDDGDNKACANRAFVYSVSSPSVLAVGDVFSIAVRDGVTFAWGLGVSGQLGNGSYATQQSPAAVPGLAGAIAVSAGLTHTVALFPDGTVRTCGSNAYGQLGDGTRDDRPTPASVPGLTGVVAVAAGNYHSVALRSDGTVWTWGANGRAQIGDGTGGTLDNSKDRLVPVEATGLADVAAISAGGDANVAIRADGTLWGWGDPRYGQVEDGLVPQRVGIGLTGVVQVAVGGVHVIVRKSDGTVWTWGYRLYGSIGDGTSADSLQLTPKQVVEVTGAIGVAASASSSAALLDSHSVLAWGDNAFGEIGDGSDKQRDSPVYVKNAAEIVRINSSGQSVDFLAERADKALLGWGRYAYGDPSSPAYTYTPIEIPLP